MIVTALAAGCGGHGGSQATVSSSSANYDRPIPGAPATPKWLRVRIWRMVDGLGDPTPQKFVVRLGLREHGRTVDRVDVRGDFVCNNCSRPPGARAPRGHIAGFTVNARTHRDLSFSLTG